MLNEKSPSCHETRHSNNIPAIPVTIFSRTHTFLLLYPSGTNLIGKLETQEVSQVLKKTS